MQWTFRGAVVLAIAVAAGAFGAHGLKARVDEVALGWWQTAAAYHFYHGLGLLAVDRVAARTARPRAAAWAGRLLLAGLVLFSGSLYLMTLTGARWLGAVTPLGGTAWIAAWIALAVAARDGGRTA